MKYLGKFKVNSKNYVAAKDEVNGLYNVFYKNVKEKDVECFSFPITIVDSEKGKTDLDKIKYHWNRMINCSPDMWKDQGIFPNEQVFPIGFWNDIVVKLQNRTLKDVKFEFIEQ